jgi:hypothetical protein
MAPLLSTLLRQRQDPGRWIAGGGVGEGVGAEPWPSVPCLQLRCVALRCVALRCMCEYSRRMNDRSGPLPYCKYSPDLRVVK